ncbi:MAG TPA: serine/threonine-protein kinase [Ktedonobacteraceae bacterium]|nr:serine/threonine-protein kinase [Ktedonobacteraceae bacterium]
MQHSSLVLFCDTCGLANDPAATHCAGCQHELVFTNDMLNSTQPVMPVVVAPPPVRAVTPGPLVMPTQQGASGLLAQYPPCDFRPGSILAGRYEIRGEIGRGGFSIVYRAVDRRPGFYYREVAIKRIQLKQLTPRQIIDATETFNREVTMLSHFRAVPGIPTYYEHLTDAQNWYLVTQYIEGQTLEEYLQRMPGGFLAEQEVLVLGIAFASLMQALHKNVPPIIFRDLKPANIMITPDRSFFLIDFGIARVFTPGKAKDTTPLGSPGYAPPEQYGKAQTDQRSDIYSLGATLQHLLTGHDLLELRSGAPSRNPRPASRGLRKLLDDMLAPDPTQRPADMEKVKQRLERIRLRRPAHCVYGGIIGLLTGIFGAFGTHFIHSSDGVFAIIYLCMASVALFVVVAVSKLLEKKLQLSSKPQQGTGRYIFLGVLMGFIPVLVLLTHLLDAWLF